MTLIYHLVLAERWEHWPEGQPYEPAEYQADGFIHCTAGDNLMLKVANTFYRQTPGRFVMLLIDTTRLTSELRWEPPAPIAPGHEAEPTQLLFPHIYGLINREAVIHVAQVRRSADGAFEGWS